MMSYLDEPAGAAVGGGVMKAEPLSQSATPPRIFLRRSSFSRPSSPRLPPRVPKMPGPAPQPGPAHTDPPPKSARRLSFSGIFRSKESRESKESNQQPSSSSTSSAAIKLFSRNKREKLRARSLYSAPPPPPQAPPPSRQDQVGVFPLQTYLTEPRRPESRRLRSFSSPPDTGLRPSTSTSCSRHPPEPPLAPPLPVSLPVSPPARRVVSRVSFSTQNVTSCLT